MAMHVSILLIEGNHMSRLTELFEEFEVTDTGNDRLCSGYDEATRTLDSVPSDPYVERKAVCTCKGWTVVLDPNLWMMFHDACLHISRELSSRIFGMICEGVSGTYGYILYESGKKVRDFLSVSGEIVEDHGIPLEIESQIDKSEIFDNDVLGVMNHLGVSYEDYLNAKPYLVKEVRSPELTPEEESEFEESTKKMGEKSDMKLTIIGGRGEYSKAARKKALRKAAKKKRKRKLWG
jgi:hypothetical protein